MTHGSANIPWSCNFPPNLHLGSVPAPSDTPLYKIDVPDSDRSSRFGSRTIISQVGATVIEFALMNKEIVVCGNLQYHDIHNDQNLP